MFFKVSLVRHFGQKSDIIYLYIQSVVEISCANISTLTLSYIWRLTVC